MRIKGAVILFLTLTCLPLPLYAIEMNGTSRTYLQDRESLDDEALLPLFEYLNFSLDDSSKGEVSFHFGGWARKDLNNNKSFDNRSSNADLQYAYLNLHRGEGNAVFNIGRVPVYEGVASESVDGVFVRSDLRYGFGAAVYGGIPVETDFDKRSGDSIYGARVSHEIPNRYQIGLSYLKEQNDNSDFRTETGIDLRFRPYDKVELFGRSTFNGETSGWMEHAYYVTYVPLEKLRLSGEFDSIQYENYFANVDTTTTGVFDLDIGVLDPQEDLLLLGLKGEYRLRGDIRITALYRNYNYSVADSANYYGGGLTYNPTAEMGGGVSLHRMDGQTDRRKYYEVRLYAYKKYKKTDVTVDLFNVKYDESINGESNAFSASLTGGYTFSEKARVSADVEYGANPTFDTDIRAFIKFLYNFNVSPVKLTGLNSFRKKTGAETAEELTSHIGE
jgi:hypothetical protein